VSGISCAKATACPGRNSGFSVPWITQRRRPHLAQPEPGVLAALQEPVVPRARPQVDGALDHPAGHLVHRRLVERVQAGEPPLPLDQVCDDRVAVRPVRLRGRGRRTPP
jgi:hypothetical protein